MPDATSLHHCLQNHHQYCTILSRIQAFGHSRPVASLAEGYVPPPFYTASVVVFQLHGAEPSRVQPEINSLFNYGEPQSVCQLLLDDSCCHYTCFHHSIVLTSSYYSLGRVEGTVIDPKI